MAYADIIAINIAPSMVAILDILAFCNA